MLLLLLLLLLLLSRRLGLLLLSLLLFQLLLLLLLLPLLLHVLLLLLHRVAQRLFVPLQAHVFIQARVNILLELSKKNEIEIPQKEIIFKMLPHLFRCYCVCLVLLLQRYQPLLELVLEQVLLLQQGQEHVLQQRHSRINVKEEHSWSFIQMPILRSPR